MWLLSTLFAGRRPNDYERMAAVLRASQAEHSPRTPLVLVRIEPGDEDLRMLMLRRIRQGNYFENARKTRHHARLIESAADGELACMIDCDTMILRDLSDMDQIAEREPFDLAYTTRPNQFRLNTGVYFVRVSDLMRQWMRRWMAMVERMLDNEALHERWRKARGKGFGGYGGINQAALGYLLEHQGREDIPRIKTLELPCAEWNSVPQTWDKISEATRVVHVMAKLREMVFGRVQAPKHLRQVVKQWQQYDCANRAQVA